MAASYRSGTTPFFGVLPCPGFPFHFHHNEHFVSINSGMGAHLMNTVKAQVDEIIFVELIYA